MKEKHEPGEGMEDSLSSFLQNTLQRTIAVVGRKAAGCEHDPHALCVPSLRLLRKSSGRGQQARGQPLHALQTPQLP